ncbi:cytoplasmic 60S subunit biogenesis factor ZNF622-like [Paramacrobiotus metropolitanus]|uniref:cytoplasmic 60S subunit biogenesis factor ZNF622-like n=1 Tax=Paramacrobiotus metropolitanus TaxID=2943436 RepID=UPI00244580BC|nr:cytoplasmic 60S subunit biogenesis factor ZNF622-like [Paramacrobiotus metropolitanus]
MASSVFSCGTCRVRFNALELMQTHYKCDWHRYNLKRKVAELPPISAENFAEIVAAYQQQAPSSAVADGGGKREKSDSAFYCKECSKSFQNAKSLAAHMESKKHLERSRSYSESNETSSTSEKMVAETAAAVEMADVDKVENDEDDWEDEDEEIPPYDITVCLFCEKKLTSLEQNISHMSTEHSFFIPDFAYCNDLAGLVDYLGKKTTHGHTCLFCNQSFKDTTAVHRHMDAKGHNKMGYENEFLLEYEDFYDFSENADSDGPADDENAVLDGSGYEMTLPSGATIGHRDLNRYYKQSLRPVRDVALISRVTGQYKALGWTGSERDEAYTQTMRKQLHNLRLKHKLHIGMQTNKIMMEHYRRQYGF